jgi:hypothetical protein
MKSVLNSEYLQEAIPPETTTVDREKKSGSNWFVEGKSI